MKTKEYIKTNFKVLVDWLVLSVIMHLFVSKIIYPISIRGMFLQMATLDYLYGRASAVLFLFDLVCLFYLCFLDTYIQNRKKPYYEILKDKMKLSDFSLKKYFLDSYKKINCFKVGIYLILQLPYTVFFAVFGFDFKSSIQIESLYKLESGIYLITKFWPLGLITVALILFTALFLSQYIALKKAFNRILANSPKEFYEHLIK